MRRHIDNPNIHNGQAVPVPYVEYLAGLNRGLYNYPTAYRYLRRNRNIPERTPRFAKRTLIDRFQEKINEKVIEKFAEDFVGFGRAYNKTQYSGQRFSQSVIPLQPYHYLQEDIFGFSGYVCSECMTVNAKILKFSSQHLGLASNYSLNPL